MTAKFKVQHDILSGLHYVQVVKRKGIRVSKDQEMIVRFSLSYLLISIKLITVIGKLCTKHYHQPFLYQDM